MATPNFLQIPGNIKQEFAPFVLNPGASINSTATSSPDVSGPPQKFSFKASRLQGSPAAGLLNMFPSSMSSNTQLFSQDLSFKNMNGANTFNALLDSLPSVQIREYLPDTKLDQCINLFNDIFTKIFKGDDEKDDSKAGEKVKKLLEDGLSDTSKLRDRLARVVDQVFDTVESQAFQDTATQSINDTAANTSGAKKDLRYSYIVKFPFTLMYNLQSCVTTNIYELPAVPDGNTMHMSSGKEGWEGDLGMSLLPSFSKNIPILGKMLNTLFGNMRINYTPWWDSDKGSGTRPPEITIKFSLFNDNAQAAVNNFIFVNTIIANNRWLQYHIFQHSSSLYDVTIAGIGKQYACTGDFTVNYKGSLRKPSTYLKDLLKAHVGNRYNADAIVTDELIKIPDVYDVTLKFTGLLPQNYNTFIYNYLSKDTFNMQNVYHQSAFAGIGDAVEMAIDAARSAWSSDKKTSAENTSAAAEKMKLKQALRQASKN